MGSLVPFAGRAELAPQLKHRHAMPPRQLNLVLDDVRLRGMTSAERQAALRSLAHVLLEASGMAKQEGGDDHA
jgi:hypothetical protein